MEPLCAFVSKTDQMWHSDLCSNKKHFYCSFIDRIKYFRIAKSWYKASYYCNFSGQLFNMHLTTAYSFNKTGFIIYLLIVINNKFFIVTIYIMICD